MAGRESSCRDDEIPLGGKAVRRKQRQQGLEGPSSPASAVMGGARLRADNFDRNHFWRTIQGDQLDTISGRYSVLFEQRGIAHRNLGRRNCETKRLNATRIRYAQV